MELIINDKIYNQSQLDECIQLKLANKTVEPWERAIFLFISEWISGGPSMIIHTSGSVGAPKAISVTKNYMVQSALRTGKFFKLKRGSTCLLSLPIDSIAGKMMVVRAIVLGLNLICVKPQANPICEIINKKIDFAAMSPYQLLCIIENKKDDEDPLINIKTIIVGGSAIHDGLIGKVQNLSTRIFATFGMTETLSHIALRAINGPNSSFDYTLLDGITISVNSLGCLEIYSKELPQNKIVTNDIVKLTGTNSFRWIGRNDRIINSGGIKIQPEQVENKINKFLEGRNYFIDSLKSEKLGSKVVLFVEGEQMKLSERTLLKSNLKTILTKYEIPKDIIFIPIFKRTISGKIDQLSTIKDVSRGYIKWMK